MTDVAPGLSPAEAKFFESRGEVAPEAPAAEPVVEQPAEQPVEKPEAPVAEPKAEEDEKSTWSPERLRNEFDQRRAALKEERARRKKLEADYQRDREELARLKGMLEATQKPEPAKPAVEDPIADLNELKQWRKQQAEEAQRNSEMQRLVGTYREKAQEFSAEAPDFAEAQGHFVNTLKRELVMLGKSAADAEQQAIQIEAMAVLSALQAGENPAARVYELAKIRGYQKAAPKEQPKPEADKLANIEQGQRASKSLDSATTAKPSLSIKAFLDMDNDEQAALLTNPKEFRRLAGG